ncbi:MAG TPA: NAD-dependent epimerase/dehydratase family protein [Actinomycetota bacterium]|nr:NAD-dependent epimerase/dehydratase family protein [Actinomycetota bacterium]
MPFWTQKKVCVTGGAGFVGSFLTEMLVEEGAEVTVAETFERGSMSRIDAVKDDVRIVNADLSTREGADAATKGQEVVLNLAAKVTGIEYNRFHHADMFSANMRIGTEVIDAAARNGVGRFLVVSTACIYPHDSAVPTAEDEGERGTPEPTNAGYGWAKRMQENLGLYYDTETDMSVAVCRPFNMYGPRDHWDEKTSHVIPALIKRVLDGDDPVIVWGTGNQTRAFLHAKDGATGMKLIAEKAPSAEPINIGHDDEISMKDLGERILSMTGVMSTLQFDTSKPDGYPRRAADVKKLREVTGWVPEISLDEGLKEMIAEYERIKSE